MSILEENNKNRLKYLNNNPIHNLGDYRGLTKLEYFSGLFVQGTLSNPEAMEMLTKKYNDDELDSVFERLCANNIKIAKELIKQLNND